MVARWKGLNIKWFKTTLQVAMNLVDFCHDQRPPLIKDAHFDEQTMEDLPYTEASLGSKRQNFMGSTYNLV